MIDKTQFKNNTSPTYFFPNTTIYVYEIGIFHYNSGLKKMTNYKTNENLFLFHLKCIITIWIKALIL